MEVSTKKKQSKLILIYNLIVKNCFRGAGPSNNSREVSDKLSILKDELKTLDDHESLLDKHTKWIQQSIKNVENDTLNKKFGYITYEDMKENFRDKFVLGIQAPSDAQLTVPKVVVI